MYARAEGIARERGIILADTKFEFGQRPDGTIVLADEVLTPDSSRFWDAATWEPGGRLDSYDKQFVRNWLLHESGWDRASGAAPPPLPPRSSPPPARSMSRRTSESPGRASDASARTFPQVPGN